MASIGCSQRWWGWEWIRGREPRSSFSPLPLPYLLPKVFYSTMFSLATCSTSLSFPSLTLSRFSVLSLLFSFSLPLSLLPSLPILTPLRGFYQSNTCTVTQGAYLLQLAGELFTNFDMFISYELNKGGLDFLGHRSEGVWVTGSKRAVMPLAQLPD